MVATWQPAAPASYYRSQTNYYAGGVEPRGHWFAPAGDFGLVDGAEIDLDRFERLYGGLGNNGNSLLTKGRGRSAERIGAFDYTFSAPKSVSLVWAFSSADTKQAIEQALDRSVRAALGALEREATFARRGRGGERLEPVGLTAALFRHGDSRPTEHADGKNFGDPNLHVHAVCLNLATRADGTVGALHSTLQRDFKLCLGAVMHASLAHELQALGFDIDRFGRNGTFEITGVEAAHCAYFSARRNEIEAELQKHGVVSAEAVALAAAVAKATRGAKDKTVSARREEVWARAARALGIDVATYAESLQAGDRILDLEASEKLLSVRLADLPRALTENHSVFDRKDLLRAVATALVGTGLPTSRIEAEIAKLVANGAILEVGRNQFAQARYSTPEMVQIERESVEFAGQLVRNAHFGLDAEGVRARCEAEGLSEEQTRAALVATASGALSILSGVAGSGKTTTLRPIVSAYENAGHRVVGAASAWRIANALHDDLAIPSRAIASWLEKLNYGSSFLSRGDVLIVDEAGLLGSRETHALLRHAAEVGAKLLLVGEDRQLAPISAGSGLSLCARAMEAVRVDRIVRQRETWAREAILAFRDGRTAEALEAFAEHGKLLEAQTANAAIDTIITSWREARAIDSAHPPLLIARTNADVAAISRDLREILRQEGEIVGPEVDIPAVTPSGQATTISLARGDRIRFLTRNDGLRVINGTTATVLAVRESPASPELGTRSIIIETDINGRRVNFAPEEIADQTGRARLGWAYASTIYQSQGMTVDRAVVLVDAGFDRRQIYVAASRAREDTLFVINAAAIDRRLAADLRTDEQNRELAFTSDERREWLARRLAQFRDKETTLEAVDAPPTQAHRGATAHATLRGVVHQVGVRLRELSLD